MRHLLHQLRLEILAAAVLKVWVPRPKLLAKLSQVLTAVVGAIRTWHEAQALRGAQIKLGAVAELRHPVSGGATDDDDGGGGGGGAKAAILGPLSMALALTEPPTAETET